MNARRIAAYDRTGKLPVEGIPTVLPVGIVVQWAGKKTPAGWALCDGTNGTPDLKPTGKNLPSIVKL